MLEKLLGKDPDVVFAYQTERILKVKDWTLAIIGNIFTLGVLAYIIVYVFLILKTYNVQATWSGYVFYSVSGKGYSISDSSYVVWDKKDIVFPDQDNKGLFIGFKVDEIPEQTYGNCQYPCFSDSDCENNPPVSLPYCDLDGFCQAPSWCPSAESNTTKFTTSYIKGIEKIKLDIWSGITYPQFDSKEYISYTSHNIPYPHKKANSFYLIDILNKAKIQNMSEIAKTGAIIDVNFNWDCNINDPLCEPEIDFTRCDSKELPTNYTRIYHYRDGGTLKRNLKLFTSIKLLFRSYGFGYKFSLLLTVLQISAGLALLKMANLLSDWIILYLYPSRAKREEFAKLKTEDSVDFSDKAYKIDYINFMRKQEEEEEEHRIGNN